MADIEHIRRRSSAFARRSTGSAARSGSFRERGISTVSAEALLDRMLNTIDALCAERDRLKREQPGPTKGKVLGGRQW
jgi:hypothetical protein